MHYEVGILDAGDEGGRSTIPFECVFTKDLPVLYEGLSWQQHNDARNRLQRGVASTYFPNVLFTTFPTYPAFDFSHCTNKSFVAKLRVTLHQNDR
jgi:hypothetical protein